MIRPIIAVLLSMFIALPVIALPAAAEFTDQQFTEHMDKFLKSQQGQEALAVALQTYAQKQREESMKERMEEQFKNRVEVPIGSSPVRGPASAKITIVKFSDFECPFCKRGADTLTEVAKAYPTHVKYTFKHRPLPMHANAEPASRAAIAAGKQGKFWEMYDELFNNQRSLNEATYTKIATDLGLNLDKFKTDMASEETTKAIKEDEALAEKLGVGGTPAFFVNGVSIQGAQPIEIFKSVIDRIIKEG